MFELRDTSLDNIKSTTEQSYAKLSFYYIAKKALLLLLSRTMCAHTHYTMFSYSIYITNTHGMHITIFVLMPFFSPLSSTRAIKNMIFFNSFPHALLPFLTRHFSFKMRNSFLHFSTKPNSKFTIARAVFCGKVV